MKLVVAVRSRAAKFGPDGRGVIRKDHSLLGVLASKYKGAAIY